MNDFGQFLIALLWYAVFILLPGGAFAVLIHYLLSLPMRRRDRALFFLDLLETVLQRGQPVEQAILSAAEKRDCAIGVRFYMVAAHIEGGSRLGEALEKVPRFLPPQVNAILRAGEKLGDLKRVLPACREVLRVAPDTVRTTMHYMMAILLLFAPVACFVICLLSVLVIPRFKDVAAGTNAPLWPLTRFVFANTFWLVAFEIAIFLALSVGGGDLHWRAGLGPLVSIPQPSGGGLDYLACAVETKEAATNLLRYARRAAGWRRAGSRSRPARGRFHRERNLPPPRPAGHGRARTGHQTG